MWIITQNGMNTTVAVFQKGIHTENERKKVSPHDYHYYGHTGGSREVSWHNVVTEIITNKSCPRICHGLMIVLHSTADCNAITFSLKVWGKLKWADDNHHWFTYISLYQLLFLRKYHSLQNYSEKQLTYVTLIQIMIWTLLVLNRVHYMCSELCF